MRDVITDTNKQIATLEFVSKESIINETARVNKKFTGNVTQIVSQLLTNKGGSDKKGIQTKKEFKSDQAVNKYSFVGNLKRPFDTIQWLCPKAQSSNKNFGYEPIYIMGHQGTPYDPSLESVYLQETDIYYNGGCEHYHGLWYGGGCDMDISNLVAPTSPNSTAFYGTYFSGLIYTTYFSAAVGDGLSPLPTAAGSAQYNFPDAGAWVVINNKPNSAQVEFNFSTAGNMVESKAYTCLLYTSPSPRDLSTSRMPSSA